MKIACISDTHGVFLPDIPEGVDIVLHAGDIGPDRGSEQWLLGPFRKWLLELQERNIGFFGTWGNHDFVGKHFNTNLLPTNTNILVDQTAYIADSLEDDVPADVKVLKVYFSPWSNLFGAWAFMETDNDLAKRYAKIPPDVNIVVSHGPPKGYGDSIYWDGQQQNVGSQALLDRFLELEDCGLLICGHIHEAAGTYVLPSTKQVVNCSQVDATYTPVYNAVKVVDVTL